MQMFRYDQVSREDQSKWLHSLGEHLNFFRRDKDQQFDEAIAEIVLKGFTSQETSQSCIEVVQSLAPFYTKSLKSSNKLMALHTLGSFLLRTIDMAEYGKEKKATNDHLTTKQIQERHLGTLPYHPTLPYPTPTQHPLLPTHTPTHPHPSLPYPALPRSCAARTRCHGVV
jgi:hypothetical protein